jgi:orotate phosphoribosyltransferase
MKQDEVLSIFKETGALLDGHFRLSSGLHSNQYFQCAKVLQYPRHGGALCEEIAGAFSDTPIDLVIAPALGGIVVGQEVGRQLARRTIFAERKGGAMELRRGFSIRPGESVLVCEDVVTTGGSVLEVFEIVGAMGGKVAGVGFIVDRSGGSVRFPLVDDARQFAVLTMDVVTFPPEQCPLCAEGIPLTKPGSRPGS